MQSPCRLGEVNADYLIRMPGPTALLAARVDQIALVQRDGLDIAVFESPPGEYLLVPRKILRIRDPRIPAERDVEFSLTIEPAEPR